MAEKVRHYATDGQRILCESGIAQTEIGKRIDAPKQRIGDWCSGRSRPTPEWRRKLEVEGICPVDAWDRPAAAPAPPPAPLIPGQEKGSVAPAAPLPLPPRPAFDVATPTSLEVASVGELEGYGVTGLEAVVDRLRKLAPTLPPRERVQAIASEGRLHTVIANLRAKERDARLEYLQSPEFASDMRLLSVAIPAGSVELRACLVRLGVELPSPPTTTAKTKRRPPAKPADVEALILELQTAAEWREKGEPMLAAGLVLELCLDVHADAIARVLAEAPELAGRFIALLEPADESIVSSALERRIAVADVMRLPEDARTAVVQLLSAHGLDEVAQRIAGAA